MAEVVHMNSEIETAKKVDPDDIKNWDQWTIIYLGGPHSHKSKLWDSINKKWIEFVHNKDGAG